MNSPKQDDGDLLQLVEKVDNMLDVLLLTQVKPKTNPPYDIIKLAILNDKAMMLFLKKVVNLLGNDFAQFIHYNHINDTSNLYNVRDELVVSLLHYLEMLTST